jgi:phosphoglycolate phosphatase-like HAD superfamily hydrolase
MAKVFENLKLAFFDIDGTLIRRDFSGTLSLKSRCFNHAIETVFGLKNVDYTKILGKRLFAMTDKTIFCNTLKALGIEESRYYSKEAELFIAANDYFDANLESAENEGYYPLPGVMNFIYRLKGENIRLGLVTGNIEKHSMWKMEIGGFDDCFSTGGFGDDAEHRSDILGSAIRRNSDIPLAHICHFGDSPPDLEAARDCGIKGVAITEKGGGSHTHEELAAVGYGLVINSWLELDLITKYLQ